MNIEIVNSVNSVNNRECYIIEDSTNDIRHVIINHINKYDGYTDSNDLFKYITSLFIDYPKCNDMYNLEYTLFVYDGECILINNTTKKMYHIYAYSILGNCVDKFINMKLKNDISTIHLLYYMVAKRDRYQVDSYHSSNIFEKDFSDMTRIKECAQSIIDNINKFQERITLTEYT